jgi:hypothetical protein
MIVKKELHIDPQPNNWLDKEKKFQKKRWVEWAVKLNLIKAF